MFKALPFIVRDFMWLNLLFTFIGVYFVFHYGAYSTPYFFWIKLVGFVITWFRVMSRASRIYFYNNLGLSKRVILIVVLALDWSLAIIFLLGTNVIA